MPFPLLYVIDTAPIFLGLFAGFAGVRQARLMKLNASRERQVAERTDSLRQALDQAEKANVLISHMADHDALTGLLNRRRCRRELADGMAYARRYGHSLALVFADLDGFKQINDGYGHDAGDRYLVGFAALLEGFVRQTDRLGRWGGDEFVVLLPETDRAAAEQFVARLRQYLLEHSIHVGEAAGLRQRRGGHLPVRRRRHGITPGPCRRGDVPHQARASDARSCACGRWLTPGGGAASRTLSR